jgi:hypothetical protein
VTRKARWLGPVGFVLVVAALGVPLALGEQLTDKAIAEQILATLGTPESPAPAASGGAPAASGAPGSSVTPAPEAIARNPLDEARRALERAAGARRSGDVRHAELLEGLAREWAEIARDVVRAASVEADAGALEVAAADAGLRAERARALLEESIARRGRAGAELDKLTADAGLFPTKPAPAGSARGKPAKGAR